MNYDFIIFISLCLHFDVLVVKVHFIVVLFLQAAGSNDTYNYYF